MVKVRWLVVARDKSELLSRSGTDAESGVSAVSGARGQNRGSEPPASDLRSENDRSRATGDPSRVE